MLVGATLASIFTIPFVLPLVGGSWRLDLVVWSAPVLLIAVVFMLGPKGNHAARRPMPPSGTCWWPDWKNPLTWLLGLTFGSNNSIYFSTNAFLPDYLDEPGTRRPDQLRARLAQWRAVPRDVHPAWWRRSG